MINLLSFFAQNRILTEIAAGLTVLIIYLIVRELIWHASKTSPGKVVFALIPVVGTILIYLGLYLYGILAILIFIFIMLVVLSKRRQENCRHKEGWYDE